MIATDKVPRTDFGSDGFGLGCFVDALTDRQGFPDSTVPVTKLVKCSAARAAIHDDGAGKLFRGFLGHGGLDPAVGHLKAEPLARWMAGAPSCSGYLSDALVQRAFQPSRDAEMSYGTRQFKHADDGVSLIGSGERYEDDLAWRRDAVRTLPRMGSSAGRMWY